MFTRNVGTYDRIARIVVGCALILGFFLNPEGSFNWLYLLGVIPLVTGLFGTCGVYSLLGINTCRIDRR